MLVLSNKKKVSDLKLRIGAKKNPSVQLSFELSHMKRRGRQPKPSPKKIAENQDPMICQQLIANIPHEIWVEVFRLAILNTKPRAGSSALRSEYYHHDKNLRKLFFVSKAWVPVASDTVRAVFKDVKAYSNWVLSHFPDLDNLDLLGNPVIKDSTLSTLTNLKSLSIACNAVISPSCVEKITSLTHLDLTGNHLFCDENLMQLTNLKSLILVRNVMISDKSVQCLSNLENLDLRDNARVTNTSGEKLTNLTILNMGGVESWFHVGHESVSKLTNLTELSVAEILSNADLPIGFSTTPIDRSQRRMFSS